MLDLFKEYIKDMKDLINRKRYIVPVVLVALLSYGFVLTHYSINIDTLSANRYFEEGMLIGQNRLTGPILHKIFNVMDFNPFFVDFIAVLILICAATSFCILFKRIKKANISILPLTIFACLFISYPLINEIFVFTPASLSIAIGFLITAISLIVMNEFIKENKIIYIIFSTILIFFAISLYESFMVVYLAGIFMILLLECIFGSEKIYFKEILVKTIIYIIPAIVSMTLYVVISNLIIYIFNIERNVLAQKDTLYITLGFSEGIKNLKDSILIEYFINGLFYLPITIFIVSNIILFIISMVATIKKKNPLIILLFVFLIISVFSLSIIQANATLYRTCQVFYVFCAFTFMILSNIIINANIKTVLKNILLALIFLLVFYQAKDLHNVFYLNYVRYEEEKNVLVKICNEIEYKYGNNKTVVFVGEYEFSDFIKEEIILNENDYRVKIANDLLKAFNIKGRIKNNYKPIQSNVESYLTWGTIAFLEPNTEIYKWIDILGYKFKQPSLEIYKEAREYLIKTKQQNLENTAIIEMDKYIIVNL